MRKLEFIIILALSAVIVLSGCKTMSKTTKGAAVGTAAGGAMGAVIGKATGNTALGTIIGATVGGAAGAVIGHEMDKQAAEIEKTVPDAKVERVGEGIVVEFSSAVLFGFDQSDLSTEATASLDKLITVLNTYPDTNIEVQGHTDSKGSVNYNQTLSEKRAGTVLNYLVTKNITGSRMTLKGFGETMPKYDNDTEEGRAQNRRVEFLITANEKMVAEATKAAENK